ncbi:MAG TPA: carboxypeptidase-like regulatory domain-containing protein, partial [Flavitalea sp.]|nr:carboxypeptidase-like regulatory domain-containing protein [Flavitalea sp.]
MNRKSYLSSGLTGLCFLVMIFCSLHVSAQADRTITGKVTDETGAGLAGVSVVLKGASNAGTVTNESGNFSLRVPAGRHTLSVSYTGYTGREIAVDGQTAVNISLSPDPQA